MLTARQDEFVGRWSTPPWWVTALGAGSFLGVVMTVYGAAANGRSWSQAVAGGAVQAVFFGFAMGWVARRRGAAERAATGDLAPDQHRSAVRAARRGPVPADPVVRAAAVRLVAHRLQRATDGQPWAVLVFAAMTAVSAITAALGSPWWLLAALAFLGLLALSTSEPRRLRQRLVALSAATDTTVAGDR